MSRRRISPIVKQVITKAGKCSRCGSTEDLCVHHPLPVAKYPELEDDPTNMVVLCQRCHKITHQYRVARRSEGNAVERFDSPVSGASSAGRWN